MQAVSWRDEPAAKVIKKVHRLKGQKLAALLADLQCDAAELADFGYWPAGRDGEYHEYEADSDLRDTENVPLKEKPEAAAAIHSYFRREVRPHVDEAWIALEKTKIGYEISFNKYFYRHTPLRLLADVTADILQLEAETEGLLKKLVSFGDHN